MTGPHEFVFVSDLVRACGPIAVAARGLQSYAATLPWEQAVRVGHYLRGRGIDITAQSQEFVEIHVGLRQLTLTTSGPTRQGMVILANEIVALDAALPEGLTAHLRRGDVIPEELSGKPEYVHGAWTPDLLPHISIAGRVARAFDTSPFGRVYAPVDAAADMLATLLVDALDCSPEATYTWDSVLGAAGWFVSTDGILESTRALSLPPAPRPSPVLRPSAPAGGGFLSR